jgi:tRNA1Val (adenine37-N6)-methyltransferase
MRIGTDAVLLGAWTDPGNRTAILDIGTGCGVIALMMAQKCNAAITAIDIDEDSALQAAGNFRNSPWNERMKALHIPIQEFVKHHEDKFDMIISNPPYFSNSLRSPDKSRNIARHDDHLNAHELLAGVTRIISSNGKFCLILPSDDAKSFLEQAKAHNLFLIRQLLVKSKPDAKPKRIAIEFSFSYPRLVITDEIIIRKEDNSLTEAYRELTRDFYL